MCRHFLLLLLPTSFCYNLSTFNTEHEKPLPAGPALKIPASEQGLEKEPIFPLGTPSGQNDNSMLSEHCGTSE